MMSMWLPESPEDLPRFLATSGLSLKRQLVAIINETAPYRRWFVNGINPSFSSNNFSATEEEQARFIETNPLLDSKFRDMIVSIIAKDQEDCLESLTKEEVLAFRSRCIAWARHGAWWLGTESSAVIFGDKLLDPKRSVILTADQCERHWLKLPNRSYSLALALLDNNANLLELTPREFEELIGELLEREGWSVTLGKGSKDGGVDVDASRIDGNLGVVRSIWQAKRYGPTNKVRLSHVKELSATLECLRATKGVIITTSGLTQGALRWIKRDQYRLSYIVGEDVREWIKRFR